jgi:regulator of protease activity HflC (stomatin/prohibitin superfamily)
MTILTKHKKGQAVVAGVGIVAFFIGLIILMMGFDYVGAGHIGVTDRLGVIGDNPWGPGVKWTGLLTSTESFTTRIQLKEYDANAASSDLQVVNTKITLNFKMNPLYAPEIYKTIGKNYQDVIIAPIIQEAVKSSTALYKAENLVKERTKVKNDITDYITTKLENKGLIVTEVAITDFQFGPEFNAAIEEKQVAEQKALTAENKYKEMEWTSQAMRLQTEVIEIKKLDIEMKKLEIQEQWVAKWQGQVPAVVMTGGDNNPVPFLDMTSFMGASG